MNWRLLKSQSASSLVGSDSSVEKALLVLLLEQDLVSAIRSEIITNGLYPGIRWFSRTDRNLEVLV